MFAKFSSALMDEGFSQCRADHSLFTHVTSNYSIYVLVYVVDIIITGDNSVQNSSLISRRESRFPIRNLGPLRYLLEIVQPSYSVNINTYRIFYKIQTLLTLSHLLFQWNNI